MSRALEAPGRLGVSGPGGSPDSTPSSRSNRKPSPAETSYIRQSAQPLTSLIFLMPLIVVYEVGTRWYAIDPISHAQQRIGAFNLMQRFLQWFGVTGQYMPAATVVSLLLGVHVMHRGLWTTRPSVLLRMMLECAMYVCPLVALGVVFEHHLLAHAQQANWRQWLVLSLGAGVYEELIFRLALFNLMSFVLVDLLKVSTKRAIPLMVVISAVLFSQYHYWWGEPFSWASFSFRALAGIYFGLIFLYRGFGITAGAHSAYDVTIVLLRLTGTA